MPPRPKKPLTQSHRLKAQQGVKRLAAASSSAPDQLVMQDVQQRYDKYAQQAEKWLIQYQARGGRVYCGAGCFACCDMPIRVSLAEALITAQAITPQQAQGMHQHALAVQENARTAPDEESFVERHRKDIGFCPLLDRQTGSCTQYAARPTRCRDTFSAFPAFYCAQGTWQSLSKREKRDYAHEVARTPGTDGEVHYIAPLEHLSEPIWASASRSMQKHWGLEVWGDFWTLTTLAANPAFMAAVRSKNARAAWAEARKMNLANEVTLEIVDGN